MPTPLIVLVALATMLTASTAGFEARAQTLEWSWQSAEADGVPAASLAEARREVAAERERRVGLLPYPAVSGAAVWDPFQKPEASAGAAYRAALETSRERAAAALARRHAAGGPNDDPAYQERLLQLYAARRPADEDRLRRRWDAEAAALEALRRQVGSVAGGLSQELPADVAAGAARLRQLADQAQAAGISTAEAGGTIAHAQLYLARPYPDMLTQHTAIVTELRAATDKLQSRVDMRARTDQLLGSIPGLLDQVTQYGAGDEFKDRAARVKAAVQAARAAGDEARTDAGLGDLQKLADDLGTAAAGWLPTAGIPCAPGSPGQLIRIHLATQQLVAYDNGCPILRTPVTTGRSALPTGRGTFHIFYKAPSYHMISPWPLGNTFYYPPTWVSYAMEFIGNGTFIHTADWQPDSSYGPNSQNGAYASHGCVHVINAPLKQLYDWAGIGTTVVVDD
jgi:lipoprotein-anchoring transpeptidase ErfK/SrfK